MADSGKTRAGGGWCPGEVSEYLGVGNVRGSEGSESPKPKNVARFGAARWAPLLSGEVGAFEDEEVLEKTEGTEVADVFVGDASRSGEGESVTTIRLSLLPRLRLYRSALESSWDSEAKRLSPYGRCSLPKTEGTLLGRFTNAAWCTMLLAP